jgi:nitroreductase
VILYTFEESQVDTGIVMTYGMLAAQTLGLGTCWIGFAKIAFDLNRQIKNLAGVKGRVSGVMTIGYPDVKYYRCPPRAPVKIKGLKKEVQQIIS